MELEAVLEVALAAARAAVAIQRDHLGSMSTEAWSLKGTADFVTDVDREAEACIVDRIRKAFPDHALLAEEAATAPGANAPIDPAAAEWAWVIDPLDGTTNYLHGYPAYSASIGVLHEGEPVVGVVISGVTGETWSATRGGGAFMDGRPIHVSTRSSLPHALIGTGFPFKTLELLPAYTRQFERVLRGSAGIRRAGSAALDLCHVATGWLDGFWELSLAPWDVAAGVLIIREAGGIVTRPDGDAAVIGAGALLAGNPHIHAMLQALLRDEGGARDPESGW